MKRRSLLKGAGVGLAALGAGAWLWRPEDLTRPHEPYFSALNDMLKAHGPGRPVMLVDLERMDANVDELAASVGPDKTYRVVVKSLPSVPLLRRVMQRARTDALMVFHQPFLNEVARSFPGADVLLGKPMPVKAVETFYRELAAEPGAPAFQPARQVQWLVDSQARLLQYQSLARRLGVHMRINVEIDVGLHRGGLPEPEALDGLLSVIGGDPQHLSMAGFMGYEPHLSGLRAELEHPAVQQVLGRYRGFVERAQSAGVDPAALTRNGAGSHTLAIYRRDRLMNDLSAGSGVVKPSDFDTHHLAAHVPAVFIATPILKRCDELRVPGDPWLARALSWWNPNRRRLYFIYGGYWKARFVSPAGVPDALYHSTNQEPVTTSTAVNLAVDDYMFLRPTQSEHVMLQFGELLAVRKGEIVERWEVFG